MHSTANKPTEFARRTAVKVALGYALIGMLWIVGTDMMVEWLIDDVTPTYLHVLKGCLYVLGTAVALLFYLRYILQRYLLAEHKAQQQDERLRISLANTPITVSAQNSRLYYTWVYNAGVFFGRDQIIGKSDIALFPEKVSRLLTELKTRVMQQGRGERLIIATGPDKDRPQKAWFDLTVEPWLDMEGRICGVTCAATDITERQLSAEALRSAKDKAEQADQTKSAFLAVMNHEIRTPLNGILGFGELLKSVESLNPEQEECVDMIVQNGRQLLALIDNIFEYTRTESVANPGHVGEVIVHDFFEEIRQTHREAAAHKELQLSLTLGKSVPEIIRINAYALRGVLSVLLDNAIKFSSEGSVRLDISGRNNDNGTPELWISVADQGIGIAAEHLEFIFEPFTQIDTSSTRAYNGTGLGLAIARKRVQHLGGKLWAESNIGEGSTFHCTVPYTPIDHNVAITSTTTDEATGEKLRVLIAMDDDETLRSWLPVLSQSPVEWHLVTQGPEVLESFTRTYYNVAIIDSAIQQIDARELALRIRGNRAHDDRPVDHSREPYLATLLPECKADKTSHWLKQGFDSCLIKPMEGKDLADLLQTAATAISTARLLKKPVPPAQ
jgi:signal transduction histidine kinase